MIFSRSPTATASSPAAWGCTTAASAWVAWSSPCPRATPPEQLMMMRDLKTTVLACTPSYALTLADSLAEEGMTKEDLHLRTGLFGAEVWSESSRQAVEEMLGVSAHDIYEPHRDHWAGGFRGVRGEKRPACLRRPFLPGDHQPGHRQAAPARREGRARLHQHDQAGLPGAALPHPGPVGAALRAVRLRHAPTPAWTASSAAPTTCLSSAA